MTGGGETFSLNKFGFFLFSLLPSLSLPLSFSLQLKAGGWSLVRGSFRLTWSGGKKGGKGRKEGREGGNSYRSPAR
jgi:hypothetical protein